METPTQYIKYSTKLINKGGKQMNKLYTDTPTTINFNQATSDVIILYNDDGTKVIMVLEKGQWLQARTELDRCKGEKNETKHNLQ